MKTPILLASSLMLATLAGAATISLDFETANQFSNNFRVVHSSGTNVAYGQTSNESGNDWVYLGSASGSTSNKLVAIYDPTPVDASDATQTFGTSFTVGLKVASASGGTFGFYLFDPSDVANNLFVSFEINLDNPHDYVRFGRDGNMASGSTGTAYNNTNSTVDLVNGEWRDARSAWRSVSSPSSASGVNTSNNESPVFYDLLLTYTNTELSIAYVSTTGSVNFSATLQIPELDRFNVAPGLALYMQRPYSGQTKIDDIVITYTIPEPSTYGLILGGVAGGLMMLRRKRRA